MVDATTLSATSTTWLSIGEGAALLLAGAAGLVTDYYARLPEDTDGGWAMLAPALQEQIGRGTYDGFWATIDDVSVDLVSTDGDVVAVTLTYTTDGRTEQETRDLTVDGGLITADSGPV